MQASRVTMPSEPLPLPRMGPKVGGFLRVETWGSSQLWSLRQGRFLIR